MSTKTQTLRHCLRHSQWHFRFSANLCGPGHNGFTAARSTQRKIWNHWILWSL